jgi:dUTPase
MRIAQLLVVPSNVDVAVVEVRPPARRGGFGSSGLR